MKGAAPTIKADTAIATSRGRRHAPLNCWEMCRGRNTTMNKRTAIAGQTKASMRVFNVIPHVRAARASHIAVPRFIHRVLQRIAKSTVSGMCKKTWRSVKENRNTLGADRKISAAHIAVYGEEYWRKVA